MVIPAAILAKGKKIDPVNLAKPKVVTLNPKPTKVKMPSNISARFKAKEVLLPAFDKLLVEIGKNGIPLPSTKLIKGKKVAIRQPKSIAATPAQMKDLAITDIRYLDIDNGLKSAFVTAILEDSRGYLWIGTDGGGICQYDGTNFIHFTTEAGLSNNIVNAILEDKNGTIWIATGGGINQYNGKNFTHFTTTEGLKHNWINSLLEDSKGNIWATSTNGLIRFDSKESEALDDYLTTYTTNEGLGQNSVNSLAEDRNGNIWFGTNNNGVHRFTPNKNDTGGKLIQLSVASGLSGNKVRSLLADSQGRIWIGTFNNGLNILDTEKEKQPRLLQFSSTNGLSHRSIISLLEDSHQNVWIGTGGGVNKSLFHAVDTASFTFYSKEQGLPHTNIYAMYEDRQGILWWGTYNGLCIYDPLQDKTGGGSHFNYYDKRDGLLSDKVISILADKRGDLWFGTMGGLHRYDGQDIAQYGRPDGLSSKSVRTMMEDNKGELWFGTERGGVNRFIPNETGKSGKIVQYGIKEGLSDIHITAMEEDSKGNYWFGTLRDGVTHFQPDKTSFGGTFTHFRTADGLSHDRIRFILEDKANNIWFGTKGGGVSCYTPNKNNNGGSFKNFTTKEGLSHDWVNTILEDSKGQLWFGTWGGGITRYDPVSHQLKYYTTKDGLSNNIIWTIVEDTENRIWVATENGLSLLVPVLAPNNSTAPSTFEDYQFYTYGKADGLKTIVFEGNSVALTSKNEIWWGGGFNGGLTNLDLNHFKLPAQAPNISLNNIEINQHFMDYRNLSSIDKTVLPFVSILSNAIGDIPDFYNFPTTLDLPYELNHLTFQFAGIDLQASHKLKYSYKMVGQDKDWSPPSIFDKADYRNLSYGNYTFQVKAIGIAQIWSESINYPFTIRAPWWHTWWARLLYLSLGIAVLYGFIKWRLSKLQRERNDKIAFAEALIFAQEEERKRIARDLHDGIGQSLLLIKKQLVTTHEVTQENQQLITDTLEEIRTISRDLHPFQLEKFGLTIAINEVIQKVEQSTDLFISKEIDNIDKLLDEKGEINLYRTIQEALNNIVKHSAATAAKITIQKTTKELIVNIQDNGKGFDHELAIITSKSLGLRTMYERISAIGGKFKLIKGTPKGTIISLTIPI